MKQARIFYTVVVIIVLLVFLFLFGVLKIPAQTKKTGWLPCEGVPAQIPGKLNAKGQWEAQVLFLGIIYLTPARKFRIMLATKTALPVLETPTEPKPQPD